tara:strand:- start:180 stop:1487 length:1308 start_codon:yes stop_codon:yes gene_type:complete
MTIYKAIIDTTFRDGSKKDDDGNPRTPDPKGIMKCTVLPNLGEASPGDLGVDGTASISVIYTSPYSAHAEGGFIAFPAAGTRILVEKLGKAYYYLTSIVGPDPADIQEISAGTNKKVSEQFGCETLEDPIYSKASGLPTAIALRHPKGHMLVMKDDVPMENDEIQPDRKVHNSKIELKSSGGKIVSLDDSNAINALRLGIGKLGPPGQNKEFDGIIIGSDRKGITGPRCIKTQAKRNITTVSESGDIRNLTVGGNKFEVENTSIGAEGMIPLLGLKVKPQINMGTELGDINLVAGNNHPISLIPKAKLGPSKVIIEALGESRGMASWVEDGVQKSEPVLPPIVRITSDGDIEIISNDPNPLTGKINIRSIGDINIESTLGNVNIKGATVNMNPPTSLAVLSPSPTVALPTSSYIPNTSLRGYVPFGWMMPMVGPI